MKRPQVKLTTGLHQALALVMRFLVDFIMRIGVDLKAFASVTKNMRNGILKGLAIAID